MNAASNSATVDTPITVILDTNPLRPLNQDKTRWAASTTRLTDIDVRNEGALIVTNAQEDGGILGSSTGAALVSSAVGTSDRAFQNYDPYMRVKPSEYGNASDNVASFAYFTNNRVHYRNNILDLSGADLATCLMGQTPGFADNTYGLNYYQRGVVFDHYTNVSVSVDSNAYGDCTLFCPDNGTTSSGTRTSNHWIYTCLSGGYDWTSYPTHGSYSGSFKSPALQADGGVFTFYSVRPGQNYDVLGICPAGRRFHNGNLPADKSSINSGNLSVSGSTMIDNGTAAFCYFGQIDSNSFQWMKYNKSNDTYYFCFTNGIYQFKYQNMTSSSSSQGLTGGGPSGQNPVTFSGGSWKKVSVPPGGGSMSIPARIGQSLWASWIGTSAYFSTDLVSWSNKLSYFAANGIDSDRHFVSEDAAQTKYLVNSQGAVVQLLSGLDDIPQDGLLEKNAPISTYERSGLVLNPGDCLYAANDSQAANVSFTVTEVAI
jgi:hypothetical protein